MKELYNLLRPFSAFLLSADAGSISEEGTAKNSRSAHLMSPFPVS